MIAAPIPLAMGEWLCKPTCSLPSQTFSLCVYYLSLFPPPKKYPIKVGQIIIGEGEGSGKRSSRLLATQRRGRSSCPSPVRNKQPFFMPPARGSVNRRMVILLRSPVCWLPPSAAVVPRIILVSSRFQPRPHVRHAPLRLVTDALRNHDKPTPDTSWPSPTRLTHVGRMA